MPEEIDRRYRELVRLAYLVLPGRRKRIYRLAIARRIVDESLPRRAGRNPGRAYTRARTRVLRRAILPSWRLRFMLGPWLRALPARLPDPAMTIALARLDPAARAAYVLLRVEAMPRHEVRDQLVDAGVRDARAALEAADAVPEVAAPDLEPLLGPAVRRRSRMPIAAATVLTVVLAGGLVVTNTSGRARPAEHRPGVTMADPNAWTRAAHSLAVWPARGDLVHDTAFVGRALDAWSRQVAARRDPQLLFAGRAGGPGVALLREGDRIARYVDTGGTLELFRAGNASSPLVLGRGRYLLPPWVTGAAKAETAKTEPARTGAGSTGAERTDAKKTGSEKTGSEKTDSGKPRTGSAKAEPAGRLTVLDGVTEPVLAGGRCGRGPVLRLREPGGARTVADLGGVALTEIAYRTRSGAAGSAASGARLWERLACALPEPARPAASATAWEFWSGDLPGGARGRWICTRYALPDGGAGAYGTLLSGDAKDAPTGDCGHEGDGAVSGTWWRSEGRWYYVAAASKGLAPHVQGPSGRSDVRHGLLVVKGARGEEQPAAPVALTARPSS